LQLEEKEVDDAFARWELRREILWETGILMLRDSRIAVVEPSKGSQSYLPERQSFLPSLFSFMDTAELLEPPEELWRNSSPLGRRRF
jgi:hypothetical protein